MNACLQMVSILRPDQSERLAYKRYGSLFSTSPVYFDDRGAELRVPRGVFAAGLCDR